MLSLKQSGILKHFSSKFFLLYHGYFSSLEQIGTKRSNKLLFFFFFSLHPVQSWLTSLQLKSSPTVIVTHKCVCRVLESLPSSLSFHLFDPVLKSTKIFGESGLVPLAIKFLLHRFLNKYNLCCHSTKMCIYDNFFCKLRKGLPPHPLKYSQYVLWEKIQVFTFLSSYIFTRSFYLPDILDHFKCDGQDNYLCIFL